MLRLTARYADAWNTAWYGAPDERLDGQLTALAEALDAEGRDPAAITRTVGVVVRDPDSDAQPEDGDFSGPIDQLARVIDAYAALGIDHLIVLLQPMTEASIERLSAALKRIDRG